MNLINMIHHNYQNISSIVNLFFFSFLYIVLYCIVRYAKFKKKKKKLINIKIFIYIYIYIYIICVFVYIYIYTYTDTQMIYLL